MAARPNNSFTTLGGGVPVHYDRIRESDYGTRGVAFTFFSTKEFETKLDRCFEQLWELNPFGKGELIISAGAWVDKPQFHGLGRAFDLDGIFWPGKTFVTLHDGFEGRDRRFYLAVEAVLRMHFGEVLNYDFNAAHRDHLHISDTAPRFRTDTRAGTFFLQNALTFVLGRRVGRDGTFGSETSGALTAALSDLGIGGSLENLDTWKQFLRAVAQRGFQNVQEMSAEAGVAASEADAEDRLTTDSTPAELLRNVYRVIEEELGCTSLKPKIEGAVTAFANHPAVQNVLGPGEPDAPSADDPSAEDSPE